MSRHAEFVELLQRAATYLPINRYLIRKDYFFSGPTEDGEVLSGPRWYQMDAEEHLNVPEKVLRVLHTVKNELDNPQSDYLGWKIEVTETPDEVVGGAMLYVRHYAVTALFKEGRSA